ncbi:DUF4244 domain-containing protein [Streptomyces sp. NPDC059445]|uniref:DUF4244 domain-containing protein n=1 Tax=Streptomyces sp. NPDC059445 TaxID=3346832 RepID=UPI00368974BC
MSGMARVLGSARGRGREQGQALERKQGRERGRAWVRARIASVAARRDTGMVTSEYAVGVIAAVAFAAALYKVVTSGQVGEELQGIVGRALNVQM